MRYNITRLINEVMLYEREIEKFKGLYESSPEYGQPGCVRQDMSRELNRLRHAKGLCYSYIGQEAVQRMKEAKSLDDMHELEEWEEIRYLPNSSITKDKARGLIANAVKLAERVGYRVEYMIHEK